MYSLEEIDDALKKDKLSDVLYKLERFAQDQGLIQLAKWCSWELYGYPSGYKEVSQSEEISITKYRVVPVQWRDIYGHPVIVAPKLAFVQKVPIWIGVSEIEGYADKGFGYSIPSLTEKLSEFSNVPVGSGHVAPDAIQGLLDRIRLQARARLHDDVPRIPDHNFAANVTGGRDSINRAGQLYEDVKKLSGTKHLAQDNARLLVEKADDAIKEFGNTNQAKKVELKKWKAQAELILPPATLAELKTRAEGGLLRESYPRNRKLRTLLFVFVVLTMVTGAVLATTGNLAKIIPFFPSVSTTAPTKTQLLAVIEVTNAGSTQVEIEELCEFYLTEDTGMVIQEYPKGRARLSAIDLSEGSNQYLFGPGQSRTFQLALPNLAGHNQLLERGAANIHFLVRIANTRQFAMGSIPFQRDALSAYKVGVDLNSPK